MAFQIIKSYQEHFPALRLIGKRYTNDDRCADGGFGNRWSEWHQNSWFDELEKTAKPSEQVDNGYVGLMTIDTNHTNFAYWIGILFPADTLVPEGFSHLDLPENDVGMSWIYGSSANGEIYGEKPHSAAYQSLSDNGWGSLNENAGDNHTLVFFERYNCPRFTTPDERGMSF